MKKLLEEFGVLREAIEKKYTLFFVVSYEKGEQIIKVEISKRKNISVFEVKNYLGIAMLVMSRESMLAGKLEALLTRKNLAMRDVFDIWFFLKNKWQLDDKALAEQAIKKIEKIKDNQILQGLRELVDEKQMMTEA